MIFSKLLFKNNIKFTPRLVTSYKSHGKWGDFIICLVPISWCVNILSNSNFILRMIEWQSESSLFTIRVRGKQWYWVYKLDTINLKQCLNQVLSIGHANWYVNSYNNSNIYNYVNMLNWGTNDKITKYYKTVSSNKNYLYQNFYNSTILNTIANEFVTHKLTVNTTRIPDFLSKKIKIWTMFKNYNSKKLIQTNTQKLNYNYKQLIIRVFNNTNSDNLKSSQINSFFFYNTLSKDFRYNFFNKLDFIKIFFYENRLNVKYTSNNNNNNLKQLWSNSYIVLKQKKLLFKIKTNQSKFILLNNKANLNDCLEKGTLKLPKNTNIISQNYNYNKTMYNNYTNLCNMRLLRTNKLLVVPTNINLTIITNSFDVVHSWYLPALGIKLDCIPGRSTHHTLYIDSVGFYYGQCAEICGRYHHHMPIRLCALSYDNFLIWWNYYQNQYIFTHLVSCNKNKQHQLNW